MNITKKVRFDLTRVNGNAFMLLGTFQKLARNDNWTKEEINFVKNEAMSGNYDHLVQTLLKYTET